MRGATARTTWNRGDWERSGWETAWWRARLSSRRLPTTLYGSGPLGPVTDSITRSPISNDAPDFELAATAIVAFASMARFLQARHKRLTRAEKDQLLADATRYPLIAGINAFFESEAKSIQQGGSEYVFSREYLNIYWPADEFIFVKLTADGKFDAFYAEAGRLLAETLTARHGSLPMAVIDEAVRLNHALVNQPFATSNGSLRLRYDLLGYWHAVRNGEPALLRETPVLVEIDRMSRRYDDFQKWCREIVWWGNKKGAYLYSPNAREITPELAGHY